MRITGLEASQNRAREMAHAEQDNRRVEIWNAIDAERRASQEHREAVAGSMVTRDELRADLAGLEVRLKEFMAAKLDRRG